jgi:hypothetical protein
MSSMDMADNSMVNMGAITVDKRNDLIGNAFQNPRENLERLEDVVERGRALAFDPPNKSN